MLRTIDDADTQARATAEIRALMGRYKVSQAKLAAAVGLSGRGMSERLSGKASLTVRELGRIAKFFDVPVADLVAPPVRRSA